MQLRSRFGAGAVDLVRRAAFKLVIGPLRYRRGQGYDAERYWRDRFERYGPTGRASGVEGMSEQENLQEYQTAIGIVLDAAQDAGTDFPQASVLDIGCGPGFFTQSFKDRGVKQYTGVDITDQLFAELQSRFPDYRFVRKDVTADPLEGEHDVVTLIDVAFHIVEDERFDHAIRNLASAVAPGGLLLIGAMMPQGRRELFYVRFWSMDDVRSRLDGFDELEPVPYRDGYLLRFRRPESA